MMKLASFCRVVLFALAVPQLVSSCMTDDSSNKPVATAPPASAPIVASGGGGMARGDPGQPTGSLARGNPGQPTDSLATGNAGQPASLSLASEGRAAADYRIAPRDILQITVFQVQDLNNTVQVNEDGTVTLPLVGKVQLSGETTYEAEQTLTGKLRTYLQSPQVSISVKTYGKRITVSGEVKTPRVLADDGGTTLTQAIADAGGLSDLAASSRIHIARTKDQHVQDEIYNLDDIQAGKAPDPVLRGGDIIVAESSGTRVALKTVKDLLPFAMFASLM
jgi:polysaccharide export outer membrane protein